MDLFWVWALLVAGLLFLLLEVFIPSHGLLGVSGIACFAVSVWFAYEISWVLCMAVIAIGVVALPLEIILGVKVFPRTPVGRRMMLPARAKTGKDERSGEPSLSEYVGKSGVTTTMCRPAGVAEIAGSRVDVVTEGMVIDVNRPVTVLRVDGNRVVVREG